jgi:hypothetical protein
MTAVSLRQASLVLVLFCTGCATTIPEESHIQMLAENSPLLDRCEVLGPVYADVSGWTLSNEQQWYQQARDKVRNKAARQYPESDSVVFLYAARRFMRLDGYGIAYRCSEKSMKTRPITP